jgi:endonuclease YncB( thermonuclease family)
MRLLAALLFTLLGSTAWPEVLEGRVVSVADGDTITLLDSIRQQHRIHLPAPYVERRMPLRFAGV